MITIYIAQTLNYCIHSTRTKSLKDNFWEEAKGEKITKTCDNWIHTVDAEFCSTNPVMMRMRWVAFNQARISDRWRRAKWYADTARLIPASLKCRHMLHINKPLYNIHDLNRIRRRVAWSSYRRYTTHSRWWGGCCWRWWWWGGWWGWWNQQNVTLFLVSYNAVVILILSLTKTRLKTIHLNAFYP